MIKIGLFLVLSGFLFPVSLSAGEVIRPAGNNECYSSVRGYFFSRNHKACPGKNVAKAITNKAPKMCSCPCPTK